MQNSTGPENRASLLLESINSRLEALNQELANAKDERQKAGLAEMEGLSEGDARWQQADQHMRSIQVEIEKVQDALGEAKVREKEALELAAEKEKETRWQKAEKIAAKRLILAKKFELTLDLFVKQLRELQASGQNLHSIIPEREHSFSDSALSGAVVEHAARLYLVKLGCQWATRSVSAKSPKYIQSLTAAVTEGNGWAMKLRHPQKQEATESDCQDIQKVLST